MKFLNTNSDHDRYWATEEKPKPSSDSNILGCQVVIPEEILVQGRADYLEHALRGLRETMAIALYDKLRTGKLWSVGLVESIDEDFAYHNRILRIRADVNPAIIRKFEMMMFNIPTYQYHGQIDQRGKEWLCLYCGSVNRPGQTKCNNCNASRTWVMG